MNGIPNFAFDGMARRVLRLSEADVDQALCPSRARWAVEQALICHARGRFVQPLKPYIRPGGRRQEYQRGRGIAMVAYLDEPFHVLGLKWILGFPINVSRGKPRATAIVALNSGDDGSLIALLDGATLSARRTGAVAAISVDRLALPGRPRVAGLGAGPIMQASVEALLALGPNRVPRSIAIYDPLAGWTAALIDGFARAGATTPITLAASAREAVEGATVVIAATTGAKSYLENDWIAAGALVVSLSLDDPTPELFLNCKVIVDSWRDCCRERKLIHRLTLQRRFSRDRVHATLGQIVAHDRPGRESDTERILVNAMGMGVLDLAAAHAAYQAAIVLGLGTLEPESPPRPDVPPGFYFRPRVGPENPNLSTPLLCSAPISVVEA